LASIRGVPRGEPLIEVVVKLYPSDRQVKGHEFSGTTVDLTCPSARLGRRRSTVEESFGTQCPPCLMLWKGQ
jgi:hypothetical protein